MINFEKLKIVLFDFGDILCIRKKYAYDTGSALAKTLTIGNVEAGLLCERRIDLMPQRNIIVSPTVGERMSFRHKLNTIKGD